MDGGKPTFVPPAGTPLEVHGIEVEGLKHTYPDFVQGELRGVRSAKTLGEVQQRLVDSLGAMRKLDVFEYADVEMKAGPRAGHTTLTDLVVRVKEKSRLWGKTEVQRAVGRGETTAGLTIQARNVFGRGESLRGQFMQGHRNSQDFSLTYEKPRLLDTRHALQVGVYRLDHNCSLYSSYSELARGLRVAVNSESGAHRVEYNGVWRDVSPHDRYEGKPPAKRPAEYPGPSAAVTAAAVPSLKSSVAYTFVRDGRDDRRIPRKGAFLRTRAELAGLGGDTDFFKLEALAQKFVPLTDKLTLGLSLQAGVVRPLAAWVGGAAAAAAADGGEKQARETPLSDRLFLGGPVSVRGFNSSAVGPRQGDDALGGDLSVAASVELSFALPSKAARELGVRGHVYGNAGNCVAMPAGPPASHHLRGLLSDLKTSVGGGVLFPLPFGRLELNYSVPCAEGECGDNTHRFQLGLTAGEWV